MADPQEPQRASSKKRKREEAKVGGGAVKKTKIDGESRGQDVVAEPDAKDKKFEDKNPQQRAESILNGDATGIGQTSKERKKNKNKNKKRDIKTSDETTQADLTTVELQKRSKKDRKIAKKAASLPSWTLSSPSAGRFLDQDPIFVRDENGQDFLLTANSREVQLLSLETSLVASTHPAPTGLSVSCIALDAVNRHLVSIAYSDSTIAIWNWSEDTSTQHNVKAHGSVFALASIPLSDGKLSALLHLSKTDLQYKISGDGPVLHTTKQRIDTIQALEDCEYICARGPSIVIIGKRTSDDASLSNFEWIEIPLSIESTCGDARLSWVQTSGKRNKKQSRGLSLVFGGNDGQIHLFENVHDLFLQTGPRKLPTPRILHWHREAVSSVKFSQDGMYIISGGRETVLVLWQLETGKKQYLPHLTSEIESIVVSPRGDRYAMQMGDNSIMVLSTSELKPVANFPGLQIPPSASLTSSSNLAAVLHPKQPDHILLTVPSTRPKSASDISARPFLQTFDIRSSRHIAWQALTRNNVTDFNLGPTKTSIIPPDVHKLAISNDGTWLATVDEWVPPASDMEHVVSNGRNLQMELEKRSETYLKIWHWEEEQALWTLTTRADAPHAHTDGGPTRTGRVLALVSDPSGNGFATFGEDRCVRIWKPKTRQRGSTKQEVEWICKRTVELPSTSQRADSPMDILRDEREWKTSMVYSADGSMIAISHTTPETAEAPLVHFVASAGTNKPITKIGLADTAIIAIAFLGKYFITLSHTAGYVWDLVNDNLVYLLQLSNPSESRQLMLAANHEDGTFALVVPEKRGARLEVYTAKAPGRIHTEQLDTPISAILAGGKAGYTFLLADATIRTLSSSGTRSRQGSREHISTGSTSAEAEAPISPESELEDGVADIVSSSVGQKRATLAVQDIDADRPAVRPEQLAILFDVGGVSLPPVKDMFRAVVGLFGRKPVQVA